MHFYQPDFHPERCGMVVAGVDVIEIARIQRRSTISASDSCAVSLQNANENDSVKTCPSWLLALRPRRRPQRRSEPEFGESAGAKWKS